MRMPGVEEQVTQINEMGKQQQMMQGGSIPTPEGYASGGSVKEKAHGLIDKLDPAMLVRMMGELANVAQQVPAFNEGGSTLGIPQGQVDDIMAKYQQQDSVPAAPIAPWTQRPEGTEELLHEREGYVPEVYLDSLGKPTVGYGHLIEDKVWEEDDPRIGTQPYSEAELKAFFDKDVQAAQSGAVRNIGRETWANLNPEQQKVLTSMAFQLGETGQKKFGNMIAAIQAGDYATAAREALSGSKEGTKSKWLKQTPKRAFDLANAFDPAVAAEYKSAGGAIYLDDGGWSSWLKNKLGVPTPGQVTIPQGTAQQELYDASAAAVGAAPSVPVPEDAGIAGSFDPSQNNPLFALGDTPSSNNPETAVPSLEGEYTPPASNWFTRNVLGPEGRKAAGVGTQSDYEGQREAEQPGERAAYEAELLEEQRLAERAAAVEEATPAEIKAAAHESGQSADHVEIYGPSDDTVDALLDDVPPVDDPAVQAALEESGQDEAHYEMYGASDATQDELNKQPETETTEPLPTTQPEGAEPPTTGDEEKDMDKVLTEADSANRKKAQDEAKSIFADLGLDSLFDKKELARMAVMYAGSRLLGYGHGGSLQWASKQYIGRVDKKQEGFNQLALSGKYTPDSLQAFKKSGDFTALMPVGVAPTATGDFKTFYKDGKQFKAEKFKVGDNEVWRTANGTVLDASYQDNAASVRGTPEYKAQVNDFRAVSADQLKSLRAQFDAIPGKDGGTVYKTDINPHTSAGEIAEWAAQNNVDPNALAGLVESAYHDALNDNRQDGSRARDLVPYLNQLVVRQSIGAPDAFVAKGYDPESKGPKQYVNAQKLAILNKGVANALQAAGHTGQTQDLANLFYDAALRDWSALSEKEQKKYNSDALDDESGFYLFAQSEAAKRFGG